MWILTREDHSKVRVIWQILQVLSNITFVDAATHQLYKTLKQISQTPCYGLPKMKQLDEAVETGLNLPVADFNQMLHDWTDTSSQTGKYYLPPGSYQVTKLNVILYQQ